MNIFHRMTHRTRVFQKHMIQITVSQEIGRILSLPRSQESLRLLKYGFKAYSQNDEDGILQEIFRRVGETNRFFVEFGVEGGEENNSLYLLLQGWKGLWFEPAEKHHARILEQFETKIGSGDLVVAKTFVTPQSFNPLMEEYGVPKEIDLLSIDVDSTDYYLAEALTSVSPRVIVIEYNAKMHPPLKWVMKFHPDRKWDGSDYFGASLESMVQMFSKKGYRLVGCNITGINAFFVRDDLVADRFCAPFSAENHYEPARYFLTAGFVSGHPSRIGDYEALP